MTKKMTVKLYESHEESFTYNEATKDSQYDIKEMTIIALSDANRIHVFARFYNRQHLGGTWVIDDLSEVWKSENPQDILFVLGLELIHRWQNSELARVRVH